MASTVDVQWPSLLLIGVIVGLIQLHASSKSWGVRVWEGLTALYQEFQIRTFVPLGIVFGAGLLGVGMVVWAALMDAQIISDWAQFFCAATLVLIVFSAMMPPKWMAWFGLLTSVMVPMALVMITRLAVVDGQRVSTRGFARGARPKAEADSPVEELAWVYISTFAWWLLLTLMKGWIVDFAKLNLYKFASGNKQYFLHGLRIEVTGSRAEEDDAVYA